MKKVLSLILAAVLLSFTLCGCNEKETADTNIGEGLFSSFSAQDFKGNIVNENILKDKKVVMFNIWATFCSPCIKEMPYIAELNKEYSDKGFMAIGVPIDVVDKNFANNPEKMAEAEAIIEKTNANYTHLIPSKTLNSTFIKDIQSVPQTVFVNSEGKIIGHIYIGAKEKADWENIIKTLLENAK